MWNEVVVSTLSVRSGQVDLCGRNLGKNVVVVAEGMKGYLVHEVFKFDFRAAGELYTIQMG